MYLSCFFSSLFRAVICIKCTPCLCIFLVKCMNTFNLTTYFFFHQTSFYNSSGFMRFWCCCYYHYCRVKTKGRQIKNCFFFFVYVVVVMLFFPCCLSYTALIFFFSSSSFFFVRFVKKKIKTSQGSQRKKIQRGKKLDSFFLFSFVHCVLTVVRGTL